MRQTSNGERRLVERVPEAAACVAALSKRGRGSLRDLRVLLRMSDDYPRAALSAAVLEATHYGMTDLDRLARMVLRRFARDFFRVGFPGNATVEAWRLRNVVVGG